MRWLLLACLLLVTLATAWVVQQRWRDSRQEGPEALRELPEGWSRAVVGRPSGADPVERSESPALPQDAEQAPRDPPQDPVPLRSGDASALEHVVRRGESLSSICAVHYGTSMPAVVAALARHNAIARPDEIREGQVLRLPPLAELQH